MTATAPTVVGGVSRKRQHQRQLPQLSTETDNSGDRSPGCWQRRMMVAMATVPPPVIGGDGQRRQRVPQLLVETDCGNPKCILACTAMAMVTTAPSVVGGVGRWWRRLPQSLVESFAEMDKSSDGSPSHQQQLQQSSAESDESSNVNNSSPSCWRRRTTVETDHPVVGRDGRWWQWQQSPPQLLVETDDGGKP